MTATITNILLEQDRFKVFIELSNSVIEDYLFMSGVTSADIIQWVTERVQYYTELELKEQELRDELLNTTI